MYKCKFFLNFYTDVRNSNLTNNVVQNYEDNNTSNAHAKLAIYPNNGSPQIVSDHGVQALATISDLARFKTNDFVISKDVAVMALQVNGDTYAKIMKNAVNGKADYGTCIIDYTNGSKTEIKIQNGKMWIDGKEVATK